MNKLLPVFAGGIIAVAIGVLMVGQLFEVSASGASLAGAPGQLFNALPTLWLFFIGAVSVLVALWIAIKAFS